MNIAVVTPYFDESVDTLRRCHDSVVGQTLKARHLFVSDGRPNAELDHWDCGHLIIDGPNRDAGNLARGLGALQCATQGFDAIAFLDADNWYKPHHLANMAKIVEDYSVSVCAANRDIYRMDGSYIGTAPTPDAASAIDTNCFYLTQPAFALLPVWTALPAEQLSSAKQSERKWSAGGLIGDRIFTFALNLFHISIAVTPEPTVCYTTKNASAYLYRQETPPSDAKDDQDLLEALNWWQAHSFEDKANNCAPCP